MIVLNYKEKEREKLTILVNFIGQPSSGKTSLSAKLFARLKEMNLNVEYSPEYVKSWCYENKRVDKYGQYTIFGEEVRQQSRLFNVVDIAISDSPVMLTGFYNFYYNGDNSLSGACHGFYKKAEEDKVQVVNFFLPRKKKYVAKGRYQTQEEADALAFQLKEWLNKEGYEYAVLECPDKERINVVIEKLKEMTGDFDGMVMA